METRIIYVPAKVGKGYIGMNYPASRKLKDSGKPKMSYNDILIYDKLSPSMKEETIRHETVERRLMGKFKMPYKKAHKIAEELQDEKALKVNVRGSRLRRGYIRDMAKL